MNNNRQKGIILIILLLAAILSPLDFYIVNLALSPIQKGLKATSGQLQMIVSFYTCAYAVFQITAGRLGDLVGRKQMFLTGLMSFILSSAICGWADRPNVIITGRILQGISGAAMAPQILAIIHITFNEKEKTKVMALYSFTFGMAAVLGQYLGGILISHNIFGLGWRIIFLMNIPLGLAGWIGGLYLLPRMSKTSGEYIDIVGMVLLSLSLGLFVYPLTTIAEKGFNNQTGLMLLSGILLLFIFITYEKKMMRTGKTPLVDMNLFKYKNLTLGSIIAFLFYSSGIFYLALSIYLQSGRGWDALEAGSAIIPFGFAFLTSSLLSPVFVNKIGNYLLAAGIFFKALGLGCIIYSLSLANPTSYLFIAGLVIAGTGMGFTLSSLVRISLKDIPFNYSGLASGIVNCALQIGSAIGVAAIGSVFFSLCGSGNYTYAFQVSLMIVVMLLIIAFFIAIPLAGRNEKI
ncbi:MFS transporter [Chryseobacterium sp. NRRL B-14859]|uniref:MFS transporter n=1 Tax=unclassified Chryseobacterium TaxID=2593645 RepID=UPI000F451A94|nr:MFS transporter [Chryseobacterium sp. G0240]ROI05003.1 MFS transporter [Chryseobacterium sp. G0240]